MEFITSIFEGIKPGIPMIAVLVLGIFVLMGLRKLLEKHFLAEADKKMKVQLIMLTLSFVLLLVVIIVSPLRDTQQGQLLSLISIVLSAAIALSSTTFVGNAMAGFMLRAVKSFRVGDFIRVGDHFGRVSDRGLFHIEVQTEERDLTTLPNLYLVTNPVKVVRSSGTIVWAEVSLGYDVPRTKIKETLNKAAANAELHEPFVHVIELGDYSVVYRVSGLLPETKQLISTRSRLKECMLDELHLAGIEIVSPNFMNTRALNVESKIIPQVERTKVSEDEQAAAEEIVFDKADEAESVEQQRGNIEKLKLEIKSLENELKETEDEQKKKGLESRIEGLKKRIESLSIHLENEVKKNGQKKD